MKQGARFAAVAVLTLSTGVIAASSSEPTQPHEHALREHVVVRITDQGIEPQIRMADPDEAIVWLNYARFPARITLDREATSRVHCREPAHFRSSEGGRLQAEQVEPLGAASLCLLEPGAYEYAVEEMDGGGRPVRVVPGGRKFEGRLVVRSAASPAAEISDLRRLARYHRAWAAIDREIAEMRRQLAQLYDPETQSGPASEYRERAVEARASAAEHERLAREIEGWLEGE